MKLRPLGRSGLSVAPLAFGGNVFGWTIDEATSFQLLDAYVGAGGNLIDTADMYSVWVKGHVGGESETIIGRWLKARGNRARVVLATKVGLEMAPGQKGLSRAHILRSVEGSLSRLQTDYIDLYQSHWDDPTVPLEESLGAFAQLVKEGKARVIGASNYDAGRLQQALTVSRQHGFPLFQSLQPNYNLYDRSDFETKVEQLCLDEGIGVIGYFSLASGFLTGKYRSEADLGKSTRGTRVKKYLTPRGFRILAALDEVAAQTRSTPASVALAWLIARPSVTAPIVSATSLGQWQDLLAATQLELDRPAIERLNAASA
jgi:aryl-alcohol dehydrogenase-like predicted oxidoreductase